MSEIEDRRRRAEDYGLSDVADAEETVYAVRTAVRHATRVQMQGDVCDAAYRAYDDNDPHSRALEAALTAAFRAAGFEVEE